MALRSMSKIQQTYGVYPYMANHYSDVIMGAMVSLITSLTIVYSTVYQTQIKENIKAPRHWPLCGKFPGPPVNSPNKWPVTRKMFPFDNVIMNCGLSYSFLINTKNGCQIMSWCGALINVCWSFPTRILLGFSWRFEMTCRYNPPTDKLMLSTMFLEILSSNHHKHNQDDWLSTHCGVIFRANP